MLLSLNLFTFVIVLGIVGGIIGLTTIVVILITEKEIDYLEVEKKRAELEVLLKESKFLQLSSQIRPHFLFNALNIISTLIRIDKKREAEQATYAIASLMRYHLKESGPLVTVREELEYVKHYLTLQELRFGPRLTWHIRADEEAMELPIPLLTIQPLVENACIHGVEPQISGGTIALIATYWQGILQIEVTDNGAGISERVLEEFDRWKKTYQSSEGKLRIGLKNVHSRLVHHFGRESGLTIRRLMSGTVSQIKIEYQAVEA
ncbi:sensor histidine kinase [Brevibacillus sp. NRS-1366]|uniref:sensor histidine kinase n=1 Tax=Brevibacillus sp. NRS-1366 TaxID=3233899 RepID=UPI003D1B1273